MIWLGHARWFTTHDAHASDPPFCVYFRCRLTRLQEMEEMSSVACRVLPAVLCILSTIPVFAHHEILAKFDSTKPQTLKGTVTKVDWTDPHVHVLVNVPDGTRLVNWAVELESPVDLERSGWDRFSLKPGDAITVQGMRARDGSLQVWGNSIALASTGRRVLNVSASKPPSRDTPAQPVPRWPDGKPRLGAAPGQTGYWAKPSASSLIEN